MFGLCDIDRFKYLDIVGESCTRSKHKYKLRPRHARTNYFKFLKDIYRTGTLYRTMSLKRCHYLVLSVN